MVVLLLNESSHRRKRDTAAEDATDMELIELKPSMRVLH